MKRTEIEAYLYILVASTFWGLSGVAAKYLFNQNGISPLRLVQIRMTLAGLILFVILLIFNRKRMIISAKDIAYFLIFGIVGMAGSQFSYYFTVFLFHPLKQ
jgi:drug/metabolite transporter (DMT)-like permease